LFRERVSTLCLYTRRQMKLHMMYNPNHKIECRFSE
jgi:hypothetical protein